MAGNAVSGAGDVTKLTGPTSDPTKPPVLVSVSWVELKGTKLTGPTSDPTKPPVLVSVSWVAVLKQSSS